MKFPQLLLFFFISNLNLSYCQNFNPHYIEKQNFWKKSKVIDLDEDGLKDIISISAGEVAWWKQSTGNSYTKQIISNILEIWQDFDIADFDNDGDYDLVLIANNRVWLFYNNGSEIYTEINCSYNFGCSNVIAGNFDSDSDIEFITASGSSYGNIRLYNPLGSGCYNWTNIDQIDITNTGNFKSVDLDNDGDLDIVATLTVANTSNKLFYYLNNGQGVFTKYPIIYVNGNDLVDVIDYDNDNDLDVIVRNTWDCCVTAFKNDGNLNFTEVNLVTGENSILDVVFLDTDYDGDLDLLVSTQSNGQKIFINNNNDVFTQNVISTNSFGDFQLITDINNDNSLEILCNNSDLNLKYHNGINAFNTQIIDNNFLSSNSSIQIKDLNNDGLKDVVFLEAYKVIIFQNIGNFNFTRSSFSIPERANYLSIGDLNDDGYNDILISTGNVFNPKTIFCYFNNNNFSFNQSEIFNQSHADHAFFADIDNDQDLDIIYSLTAGNGKIRYLKNINNNFQVVSVTESIDYTSAVDFKDVDLDGYKDIITDSNVYLKNDGAQNFSVQTLPSDGVHSDLDNDGDLDILHSEVSSQGQYLEWYKNNLNQNYTVFNIANPFSCYDFIVEDYDNDGDNDIFTSASGGTTSGGLACWINNGNQIFTKNIVENQHFLNASTLYQADFDNDGDVDVVCSTHNYPFTIFENLNLNLSTIKNELISIIIFPNPTNDFVTINLDIEKIDVVKVYDIVGKQIKSYNSKKIIDFSNHENGIYLLEVVTKDNKRIIKKVVKQN